MTNTVARQRLAAPDVTRAAALIGVVVMNYHGYLNGSAAAARPGSSFAQRLFDPWNGVLSTRFAATFVLVAGIGVTLLTNTARLTGDREALRANRWRLVRRGLLLYASGFVLDWIWPGTILFYYGAMFVIAGFLFTLRTRWVIVFGAAAVLAAAGIQWWGVVRVEAGRPLNWLFAPATQTSGSPRGLVFDTFVNGTHPLLPWLGFLCAGIVLGRHLGNLRSLQLAAFGASLTAVTYVISHFGTNAGADNQLAVTLLSTDPYSRGLAYVAGALGSSLCAYGLISWAVARWSKAALVSLFENAGQMTLTVYVAHVVVFRFVVDRQRWVGASGLDAALIFAIGFWVVAITGAAWWRRFVGLGPLERVYRQFGG